MSKNEKKKPRGCQWQSQGLLRNQAETNATSLWSRLQEGWPSPFYSSVGFCAAEICQDRWKLTSADVPWYVGMSSMGEFSQASPPNNQKTEHLGPQFQAVLYFRVIVLCDTSTVAPQLQNLHGMNLNDVPASWQGCFVVIFYKCLRRAPTFLDHDQSTRQETARMNMPNHGIDLWCLMCDVHWCALICIYMQLCFRRFPAPIPKHPLHRTSCSCLSGFGTVKRRMPLSCWNDSMVTWCWLMLVG